MLTDFEKRYILNLIEKDTKIAKKDYEQAVNNDTPFEDILKLSKVRRARESIEYMVKKALKRGEGKEIE